MKLINAIEADKVLKDVGDVFNKHELHLADRLFVLQQMLVSTGYRYNKAWDADAELLTKEKTEDGE